MRGSVKMVEEKVSPYRKYLREERLPHLFCPGCGNGTVMSAFFKGLEQSDLDFEDIVMVSGIGCSSRVPGYVKCDSLHTTHGRALTFATGLKLGNPDLNVVVFTGDGDSASIGGNHLINAARRNVDLTVICINNNIYGMTGGQISPTSPRGSFGTTAPYGSRENPFRIAEIVGAAGAAYVARWTTAHPMQLSKAIQKGLNSTGFSFIEAVSQCPTYYGRKNKLKTTIDLYNHIKEHTITKRKAEKMDVTELQDKIIVGDFANPRRGALCKALKELTEEVSGGPLATKYAYEELD